jgi:hypothetical protein
MANFEANRGVRRELGMVWKTTYEARGKPAPSSDFITSGRGYLPS